MSLGNKFSDTIKYRKEQESQITPHDALECVYKALIEKGYDPVDQIVGYFLSDDPTYITSHENARGIIGKVERYDLIEELVSFYIENNLKKTVRKHK